MRSSRTLLVALLAAVVPPGCQSIGNESPPRVAVDIPISRMPFTDVQVNWKERRAQRYAYQEILGDYRRAEDALAELGANAYRFGLRVDGPAFCLFYDDPSEVPVARLRARVCLPVAPGESLAGPWDYDDLAAAMVAYAVVSAPRGAVPLSYPGVLAYIQERGWSESGPVREIHLFTPEHDGDGVPLTEVQIPWRTGGQAGG